MIPPPFRYARAASLDEALQLLAEHGDEAKCLAGGHSLVPLMKLRLAAPSVLVDIGRLRELSYVREEGDRVAIGALSRHRDLEVSEILARQVPILPYVAGLVGDPQVRHRGTIGGSIAHGDPASDLPAAILALEAELVLCSRRGRRVVAAIDFFRGFLETALEPDEILVEIRVPKIGPNWSYQKFNQRAQDWAIVGAAVVLHGSPRIALVNMGGTPLRAPAAESALAGGASITAAAELAAEGTLPTSDGAASAEFRRHLARVLVRRGLEEATAPGRVTTGRHP
ncbi:xanthine dehydrogenase family protein subunit M [bacterium]|nr:MAG: xanthine dehydrogenase family protein subunit M [bacterium]